MRRGRNLFAPGAILLLTLGLVACGGGTSPEEEKAAQDTEELAWLEKTKSELDAKRQELREMRAQVTGAQVTGGEDAAEEDAAEEDAAEGGAAGDAAESDATEAAEAAPLSPEEVLAAQEEETIALAEEFSTRLIGFINTQDIFEGEPLTETQRKAFDMKTDEEILIAKGYIERGGDYQGAINVYITALNADPENEKLLAAKAEAESLRYMTEDRFSQVKKKMTQDEVREILGTPKHSNIREFDNGAIGWFYRKEEPRTAAGVYFEEKDGEYVVYRSAFDAMKDDDE